MTTISSSNANVTNSLEITQRLDSRSAQQRAENQSAPAIEQAPADEAAQSPQSSEEQVSVSLRREQSLTYSSSGTFGSQETSEVEEASAAQEQAQPTQAASNILSFISARVVSDQADGATTEALVATLQEGLNGFVQGFTEAFEVLDSSGLLTAEVGGAVLQTFNDVLDGVDALAQELGVESPVTDDLRASFSDFSPSDPGNLGDAFLGLGDGADVANTPNQLLSRSSGSVGEALGQLSSQDSITLDIISGLQLPEIFELDDDIEAGETLALGASFSESRNFSFELQTQDGDVVRISASSDFSVESELFRQSDGEQSSTAIEAARGFEFSVDGELDEEELSAILNVLADVSQISDDFFSGDIEGAFERTLNLNLDSSEIAGFAFDLQFEQTTQVALDATQTYLDISQFSEQSVLGEAQSLVGSETEAARLEVQLLTRFVENLQQLGNSAESANLSRESVFELTTQTIEARAETPNASQRARAVLESITGVIEAQRNGATDAEIE